MSIWNALWQTICLTSASVTRCLSNIVESCAYATVAGSHINDDSALAPFHFPAVLEDVSAFGDNWLDHDKDIDIGQEAIAMSVITVEPRRVVPPSVEFPPLSDDCLEDFTEIDLDNDSIYYKSYDAAAADNDIDETGQN